jgi:hypothetical protein
MSSRQGAEAPNSKTQVPKKGSNTKNRDSQVIVF